MANFGKSYFYDFGCIDIKYFLQCAGSCHANGERVFAICRLTIVDSLNSPYGRDDEE
jgi:hypothetical protein